MFLALVDRKFRATIHLNRRAAVGLFDNSRPSFSDLIQPLRWALFELSVSLPTLPQVLSVRLPTPPLSVGFRRQSLAMCPSRPQLKQLLTAFTLETGNLSGIVHLLAVWPNLLHLLHLKGGPLAAEGDLSFTDTFFPSLHRHNTHHTFSKLH